MLKFVIKNVPVEKKVKLTVNRRLLRSGPDFREGFEKAADGVVSLVV